MSAFRKKVIAGMAAAAGLFTPAAAAAPASSPFSQQLGLVDRKPLALKNLDQFQNAVANLPNDDRRDLDVLGWTSMAVLDPKRASAIRVSLNGFLEQRDELRKSLLAMAPPDVRSLLTLGFDRTMHVMGVLTNGDENTFYWLNSLSMLFDDDDRDVAQDLARRAGVTEDVEKGLRRRFRAETCDRAFGQGDEDYCQVSERLRPYRMIYGSNNVTPQIFHDLSRRIAEISLAGKGDVVRTINILDSAWFMLHTDLKWYKTSLTPEELTVEVGRFYTNLSTMQCAQIADLVYYQVNNGILKQVWEFHNFVRYVFLDQGMGGEFTDSMLKKLFDPYRWTYLTFYIIWYALVLSMYYKYPRTAKVLISAMTIGMTSYILSLNPPVLTLLRESGMIGVLPSLALRYDPWGEKMEKKKPEAEDVPTPKPATPKPATPATPRRSRRLATPRK